MLYYVILCYIILYCIILYYIIIIYLRIHTYRLLHGWIPFSLMYVFSSSKSAARLCDLQAGHEDVAEVY
jgi:Na+/H+-dicarboxylate symporter